MHDRFEAGRRALEEAVLDRRGHTGPDLRRRVAERRDVPADPRALVDKIEHHAYRVTDQDLARWTGAGSSTRSIPR